MELERILRSQGFGSRSECRGLIAAGRVRIADIVATDPFADLVPEGLAFEVDDQAWRWRAKAYLMLNKPAHYECSRKPSFYPSVYGLLPVPLLTRGVQAVGRLDEDTTGLLLLSDDGQFIHTYATPKRKVPKIYEVTVKHPLDERQVADLLAGVKLHDEPDVITAAACRILSDDRLEMTVTEGKYHLVKRMIAAVGNRVVALTRTRIGGLVLPPELEPGQWRWLAEEDLAQLAAHA